MTLPGESEKLVAAFDLAFDRFAHRLGPARTDLDLRSDQLAGGGLTEDRIRLGGLVQLGETVGEIERAGIDDRELLFETDREVTRGLENLTGGIQVEQIRVS